MISQNVIYIIVFVWLMMTLVSMIFDRGAEGLSSVAALVNAPASPPNTRYVSLVTSIGARLTVGQDAIVDYEGDGKHAQHMQVAANEYRASALECGGAQAECRKIWLAGGLNRRAFAGVTRLYGSNAWDYEQAFRWSRFNANVPLFGNAFSVPYPNIGSIAKLLVKALTVDYDIVKELGDGPFAVAGTLLRFVMLIFSIGFAIAIVQMFINTVGRLF